MSKMPVWIVIRSTFNEKVFPITLYYVSESWGKGYFTKVKDDASQFMTKREAYETIGRIVPRHGNESVMQIEVESIKVL